jgi:tetratricopeptide (TPR) repeat protein
MVDLRPDLPSFSRVSYQRELHGQVRNAITAMEEAVEIGSGIPENREYVRVLLGNLHLATGDLVKAERIYAQSLDQLPGFTWALAGMARVRAAQGRFDEAIDLYRQAADRIPLPEFLIGLGEMQEAAGRTREANDTYQVVRAVQQLFATNGVDTDLDLALFEANHGTDPAAALKLARAAYERQPNIKAADALAWALFKNGELDEARKRVDESLRLGTHDGLHLYHAGEIAHAQGDDAAARRYLSRALQENPTFSPLYAPAAQRLLDELGGPVPSASPSGS